MRKSTSKIMLYEFLKFEIIYFQLDIDKMKFQIKCEIQIDKIYCCGYEQLNYIWTNFCLCLLFITRRIKANFSTTRNTKCVLINRAKKCPSHYIYSSGVKRDVRLMERHLEKGFVPPQAFPNLDARV